jgi:ABC-type branched-subunit amino acid transport system substrate-binding protein
MQTSSTISFARASSLATALLGLGLLAGPLLGGQAWAAELTATQRAGKKIYLEGESPSGAEITVRIGRDASTLPGTAATCGSCHGADGLGRPEGGALPTGVTWPELVRPHGHVHPNGRSHPAYDERSLARALRDGADPAGNPLDPVMPRYTMPDADMASLIAYLKVLERDLDPGIGQSSVRIGVVLPTRGRLADVGTGMRKVLEARVAGLNRRGGVNGRKLDLLVEGYDADAGSGLDAARRLLQKGKVFALLSGFFPSSEGEVGSLAESEKVPLIGPFTLFASQADSVNPWVFHLMSGLRDQARVLAAYAARDLAIEPGLLAIVHPEDERGADAAAAARSQLGARAAQAEVISYAGTLPDPALAARLGAKGVRAVIFLGSDAEFAAFARAADAAGFTPYLLAPGTLAARAAARAPASFQGRVLLAYPSIPSDETPAAAAELARIRTQARISDQNRASQVAAFVAFDVLVEGLRRAGRHLSRERLVASLEALYDFENGLLRPITYGPNRRVGALGGHVVAVDLPAGAFSAVGGWRPLE